jgi:multicopper oxidase
LRTFLFVAALTWIAVGQGDLRSAVQASLTAESCAEDAGTAGGPDADLYCIELLPANGLERAAGAARLLAPSSPFGLAVTAAGEPQYDVEFNLRDLPEPPSLGPYTTYVAWATTPQISPTVKLGIVRNGVVRLGRVTFDRILILITAESSPETTERAGRLVLRGTSASVRMQPHDLAFVLSGFLSSKDAPPPTHAHEMAHDAATAPGAWTPPPMHPRVTMPPELMTLRPDVSSYLPRPNPSFPLARPRELLRLANGAAVTLVAAPVRRVLFGRTVTMLGFNGQYPGPLIQVDEGSTIVVRFTNHTDFPTAMHWHGVRLDNRFDGVPHVTQEPVAPGASFEYRVHFRDAGIYWYHPHHREDVLQDLGLYGNLLVRSRDPNFFAPANREEVLMLDDLLVNESRMVGYGLESPTHALMGRFGNVLLVNGEPRWETRARRGDVVRLFLTNVSSTRVFNLSFQPAARIKVVASDLSRYEREESVDHVTIAPAERYVVDVRFDAPGDVSLVNRVRAIDHVQAMFFEESHALGTVHVTDAAAAPDHRAAFDRLRRNSEVVADIDRYRSHFQRPPDHELVVTLQRARCRFRSVR